MSKSTLGLYDELNNSSRGSYTQNNNSSTLNLHDNLYKPVNTPSSKEEKVNSKRKLFSGSKVLDDGFQFSDLFKLTYYTAGDIVTDVAHGIANIGEGLVDAARYGISGISRAFGAEKYANDVRERAQENTMDKLFSGADKYFDEGSILGEKIDGIMQSLGYMGGIYVTAGIGASAASAAGLSTGAVTAAGTAASTGTTFAAAFGNSASEAYNEGATDAQATRYGLIAGLAEAGTNLLFGGMGQLIPGVGLSTGITDVDSVLAKNVSQIFKKQWQKNLAQYTIKSGAEGFEEFLSGLIQATGQYITYKTKDKGYTWSQLVKDQNLLEQFISGAVVSAIAQSPSLIISNKAGKDFVTNLTAEEEAQVIEKSKEEISKQEKTLGRTLTAEEKNDIRRTTSENVEITSSLSEVLSQSGITSESISAIKDVNTANDVVAKLLEIYTSIVPMKNLNAHINSDVYSLLVQAEQKRNELREPEPEIEKIKRADELQDKIMEAQPDTVESILAANEINAINKDVDKNNKIPVMQNRTFKTKYDGELLNQAKAILTGRGFAGDIVVNLTAEESRIEDVGAVFGKKVIFLQGADFAGVVMPENSDIIFINEKITSGLISRTNNKNKMLYTLGHELYHSMKMADPETYNQFIDYVKSTITSEQLTKFMSMYDSADTDGFYSQLQINGKYDLPELLAHPDKYPSQTIALNRIVEEMVANEFGGMITDVEYMKNLNAQNKTLFEKIVAILEEFFETLTKPIYKTSLTQIQVSEIRDRFNRIINEVKTSEETVSKEQVSKTETKKSDVEKVKKPDSVNQKVNTSEQKVAKSDVEKPQKVDKKEKSVEKPAEKPAEKPKVEVKQKVKQEVKPKQPTLIKPVEVKKATADNQVKEVKPKLPTKPEDIGKETKTVSMDMDAWYVRINEMLDNANKLTGVKHRDALKSVSNAYNNYKAKGGTRTIKALEDSDKLDFKNKLLSKMDVRKLPNTDTKGNKLSKEQQEFFKDIRYLPMAKSKFASNINENRVFKDLVEYVKTNPELTMYETTSHKADYNKAVEMIKNDAKGTIEQFMTKTSEQLTSVDAYIGKMLVKVYQQYGDVVSELLVYNKLKEGGTKKGQYVDALKILKELSPGAFLIGVENDLARAYSEMSKSTDKSIKKWFEKNKDKGVLTPQEEKWIYSMVDSVKNLDPDSRKYQLTHAVIDKFIADRIPVAFTTKLKTFRRLAMLFNPKTQVRNFGGNVIMLPINAVSDLIGTQLDKRLSKETNIRTTDTVNFVEGMKDIKEGIKEVVEDSEIGVTTMGVGEEYEINVGQTWGDDTSFGRAMNWVEKTTNYLMEGGDRGFQKYYYNMSLRNQMRRAGVTEPTETMKQIATEEAAKRTWKNNSKMVQIAGSARETLNKIHIGDFGMGDIILPFVMTPANLAVATYEYSPAAAISVFTASKKYTSAIQSGNAHDIALAQKQLVDTVGKATSGTILYALAYILAKSGKITGDEDEDKDIRNLMKAQGFQPFSVQVGDKSYTYDWAQPIASPFAVMAELERTTKLTGEKQNILEATLKAFSIGGTRLYEQSFLSSLKTLFSGDDMFEGIIDTAMSVPASFVPTLFNQMANLLDSSTKATYDGKDPWKTMLYKTAVKIPGVKSLLPNKYDVLGNQVHMYNGNNNIINVMLNPANVSGDTVGDAGAEVMDVYNNTGVNSVIPQVASTYLDYTVNGVKQRVNFTLQQQSELQQSMGDIARETINEMMLSDVYNSASYEQKATALTSLMQYARAKAIEDSGFAKGYTIKSGNASQIKRYLEGGLTLTNAVMYDGILSGIKGITDASGETVDGSVSGMKAYAIINMPTTDEQKNKMLKLLSPTAKIPETVTSLSNLATEREFINYYSLSRSDYMVKNNYSRDDYDIAVGYYRFDSNDFIKYTNDLANIKSDVDSAGNTVSGSKKRKIVNYINSLPLSSIQKVYLYGQAGYSIKPYKTDLFNYVNGLNISKSEKERIWKNLGF